MSVKEAFRKNEVVCMVCGKGGFKTLARHLSTAHQMKPGAYKKQFGIPREQALSAKSYSESRKKMALDRGLADNLAKARAVRMANIEAKKTVPAKRRKRRLPPRQKTKSSFIQATFHSRLGHLSRGCLFFVSGPSPDVP